MQNNVSPSRIKLDRLFYHAAMNKLTKLETVRRSSGRHIVGRVLRAEAKQRKKGRKVFALHQRGGHW